MGVCRTSGDDDTPLWIVGRCGVVWKYSGREVLYTTAMWAGDQSSYYTKLEANGNSTHPVRGKQPNAWGLYDTLGNAWEWVGDWDGLYSKEATMDPASPPDGTKKVMRGGAWDGYPPSVRLSTRFFGEPTGRSRTIGFRCARSHLDSRCGT
jgi:formylglycine-generating enzyme required for sulfatase activity